MIDQTNRAGKSRRQAETIYSIACTLASCYEGRPKKDLRVADTDS